LMNAQVVALSAAIRSCPFHCRFIAPPAHL
jgi:hypothetical protein